MLDILVTVLFFFFLGVVLLSFAAFSWTAQAEHDNDEEERRIWLRNSDTYTLEWDDGTTEIVTWEGLLEKAPEEAAKYM